MGSELLEKRLLTENSREQRMGGYINLCPMRILRPIANLAFKATGLWNRAHREFMNPVVRENEFQIPGLPKPLRGFAILHLSDMHLDLDTRLTHVIYERVEALRFDVAVVTGDFNNYTAHTDGQALVEMRSLMPAFGGAPVFGVLGNHDSMRDIAVLEDMGIRILLNENVRIERNGQNIAIAGIDDPNIFATHDLDKALAGTDDAAAKVLLSHSPGIHKEAARHGVDIMLCGHIHGGQICLPGGKMLRTYKDQGATHVLRGRWSEGSTQGWTSAGTGSCGVPLRLNCPPEILLHRLIPA